MLSICRIKLIGAGLCLSVNRNLPRLSYSTGDSGCMTIRLVKKKWAQLADYHGITVLIDLLLVNSLPSFAILLVYAASDHMTKYHHSAVFCSVYRRGISSSSCLHPLKVWSHLLLFAKFLLPKSSNLNRNPHDREKDFPMWIKHWVQLTQQPAEFDQNLTNVNASLQLERCFICISLTLYRLIMFFRPVTDKSIHPALSLVHFC